VAKLIGLRVTLAVDDVVDIKDVKPRLTALISAAGTENLGETTSRGPTPLTASNTSDRARNATSPGDFDSLDLLYRRG
jgi:hypothetical protein